LRVKICVSVPEELKTQVEEYNKDNPYAKINVSQVAQAAIHETLMAKKAGCIA